MIFRQKIGVQSVRLALSVLAGSAMVVGFAQAQEAAKLQKVEITGSSIKRIAKEGALPVQQLTQEAIVRSGATTIADLIQKLPAMQGFTVSTTAVGTNSGGRVSASIHDIGEDYTLVLLNGRRVAPQGSGSAVNLNAIPMSAVERVEILTDGASAIYGSDAIAGVLNFILKKNERGGTFDATYAGTQEKGAENWNANFSYGIGDFPSQGYNVLFSYRRDDQKGLKAGDREFSKTGFLPFSLNGTNYIFDRTSPTSVPANVSVTFRDTKIPSISFNPYLKKNGTCPELHYISIVNNANTTNCVYDFASAIEIVPSSTRDSFFTTGRLKVSNDITLFSDIAYSRYDLIAKIASNPVPFTVDTSSSYYKDSVLPHLSAAQAASVRAVSGSYRMYDWGTRDSNTVTDSKHFVLGAEAELSGWSINTAVTWGQNSLDERYIGGYAKDKEFRAMLAQRSFDPFAPIGKQSDATKALISNSLYNGSVRTASTTLTGIDGHASKEIFNLPGGGASLGLGADYREYHYVQDPSADAVNGVIYNFNPPAQYDMKRSTYGLFTELLAPITKELEATVALRYDSFAAINNGVEKRTMGERQSASTFKLSVRYQPTTALLIRGSVGTGFKAPDMLNIAQPLVSAGVTNPWACPFPGTDFCKPGVAQYDRLTGGNEKLRPEKSEQYTIGFRFEPTADFSVGADLWDVQIKDAVSSVSQQQVFGDPVKYRELFTTFREVATGNTYWAYKDLSINLGRTHNRGIDWDMTGRQKFGFGTVTSTLSGTYLLKSDYTVPGSDTIWTSNLGIFGINNGVAFRNIAKWTTTVDTGPFTNAFTVSYRTGYTDAEALVRNLSTGKNETFRLDVPSYTTVDWQGIYKYSKALEFRVGIKNLFNQTPPLSLRSAGGGQHVGYDPRYTDSLLRNFYMTGNYKF